MKTVPSVVEADFRFGSDGGKADVQIVPSYSLKDDRLNVIANVGNEVFSGVLRLTSRGKRVRVVVVLYSNENYLFIATTTAVLLTHINLSISFF